MRRLRQYSLVIIGTLVVGWIAHSVAVTHTVQAQSHPIVTEAMVDKMITDLSNWGRWGKDDQMGTVNLITPAKRKQALSLGKEGVSFSLARDEEFETAADDPSPFVLKMNVGRDGKVGGADSISVSYHGFAHTHMDALCHFQYKGKVYNGFSADEILTTKGALKNSVNNFKSGIMTRGILMDIPRLKGVDYLEPGTHIYPEDLDAWEKKAHVRVGSGDVIFIRTGKWALRDKTGAWDVRQRGLAGLDATTLAWLKSRDVAMVGSDGAMDVLPSGVAGVVQPIHLVVLVAMGTPIFDNCDLELVSREANRRQRWEFLVTASPIAIPGGTGSPLNPIATF
jgi:kynurenine formamidase